MMELQAVAVEQQVVAEASKVAPVAVPLVVEVESRVLAAQQLVLVEPLELPKKLHKMDKTARLVPLLFCRKDTGFQQVQHPVPVWVAAVEEEREPVALAFASKGVVVRAAAVVLIA